MRKAVFIMLLVIIGGCNRQTEITKIANITCRDCGKVLSSDTSTVMGLYNKSQGIFTDTEGKIYMTRLSAPGQIAAFSNESVYCDACKDKRRVAAKKLLKDGKRAYWAGNYSEAMDDFKRAIRELPFETYAEAEEWKRKTDLKLDEQARINALKEAERKEKERIAKERKERRRKEKQELIDKIVECANKFDIATTKYTQMNYDLKYRTPSTKLQQKANELEKYADNVYLPAAQDFQYYFFKYTKKYGAVAGRDLAIQYGFMHLLN